MSFLSGSGNSASGGWRFAGGLLAILALAAGLRFSTLGHGLRHAPHWDEQAFVESVALMLSRGDLDHRFYEYPGLFFYLSAPFVALTGTGSPASSAAYLAVRGVCAASGVASVALLGLLGRPRVGPAGALAAALYLAVSPVEVSVAQTIRPDVTLEVFALLALLALTGVGKRLLFDARAGFALGAAAAVKFTGLLLVPSYLLRRALTEGPRLKGAVIAGLAALLTFLAFTPYAILEAPSFLEGVSVQGRYHYAGAGPGTSYWAMFLVYLAVLWKALGPVCLLAAAGLYIGRSRWREIAPIALYPLLLLAVFATSPVRQERFILSGLGVIALFAGATVGEVSRVAPVGALLLVAVTATPLLASSLSELRALRQPSTRDRVADWLKAHAPTGARVLSSDPDLRLEANRFEVLLTGEAFETPGARRLLREVDFAVGGGRGMETGLRAVFRAEPQTTVEGAPLVVYEIPATERARYRPVPLGGARLRASENEAEIRNIVDAREATFWSPPRRPCPGAWVEVEFERKRLVARLEASPGAKVRRFGRRLKVLAPGVNGGLEPIATVPGRAPVREQPGKDPSQVLLFAPICADRLRLVEEGSSGHGWAIAELGLFEPLDPDGELATCP